MGICSFYVKWLICIQHIRMSRLGFLIIPCAWGIYFLVHVSFLFCFLTRKLFEKHFWQLQLLVTLSENALDWISESIKFTVWATYACVQLICTWPENQRQLSHSQPWQELGVLGTFPWNYLQEVLLEAVGYPVCIPNTVDSSLSTLLWTWGKVF